MAREVVDGKLVETVNDPFVPVVGDETISALDKLRDELANAPEDKPAEAPEVTPEVKPEDKPAETPEVKPDDKSVETPEDKPAETPEVKPEDKPTETPEVKPEDKPADEFSQKLDAVELPPHARPKSAEAFTKVKEIARQEIESVRKQLEVEKKAREEAEAKAKEQVAREEFDRLKAEADELRKFKYAADIESDPKLLEFDKQIQNNDEAILSKFVEAGGKPEQIAKIKEMGGPRKIDWEPLFKHMTPPQRRFIEAKLVESEGVSYNKSKAVETAKSDVAAWQKEYNQRRQVTADQEVAKAEWLRPVEIKSDAKPEDKAAATAHNQRISQLKARISQAIADTSPEMHATLAVGTALAHDLHWQLTQLVELRQKEKAKLTEDHTKAVDALTKERDALKLELDRIKKASRGASSGSIADGRAAAPKRPGDFDLKRNTADVLDDLAKQAAARD